MQSPVALLAPIHANLQGTSAYLMLFTRMRVPSSSSNPCASHGCTAYLSEKERQEEADVVGDEQQPAAQCYRLMPALAEEAASQKPCGWKLCCAVEQTPRRDPAARRAAHQNLSPRGGPCGNRARFSPMLCVNRPNSELPPNAGTPMLAGTVHLSRQPLRSRISSNAQPPSAGPLSAAFASPSPVANALLHDEAGHAALRRCTSVVQACWATVEPHPRKPSTKTRGSLFSPAARDERLSSCYMQIHILRKNWLQTASLEQT